MFIGPICTFSITFHPYSTTHYFFEDTNYTSTIVISYDVAVTAVCERESDYDWLFSLLFG